MTFYATSAAKTAAASALLFIASIPALADDEDKAQAAKLEAARIQAEQSLRFSFNNFKFHSINHSVVDGLYEIDTGGKMVYFAPDAGVLIFGEMWNDLGVNLSEEAIAVAAAERMKDFDFSVALTFGPEDAPLLTEYSNPHCGYCQQLHGWLENLEQDGLQVRRQIIFTVGHSPEAQNVAEHILCSDDPEKAFADVYERRTPRTLIRCDEGYTRVQKHIEMAEAAGVSGTPTLFADGERIRGFDQAKIREFLDRASLTSRGEER